jgi:hypothetical protein
MIKPIVHKELDGIVLTLWLCAFFVLSVFKKNLFQQPLGKWVIQKNDNGTYK